MNELGMDIEKVNINLSKLTDSIEIEKKVNLNLERLNEKIEKAYYSEASLILKEKRETMSESEYSKIKNLSSYKLYIEKQKDQYRKATQKGIEISKNINLK